MPVDMMEHLIHLIMGELGICEVYADDEVLPYVERQVVELLS